MDTVAGQLVLIVEDDALIARLIATMLRAHGYQTHICPSAEAALSDLPALRPALLTLDLNLPGMSGAGLLQQLRAAPAYAGLPVILITAQQQIPPEARALANGVLFKPFGLDELMGAVRAAAAVGQPLAERAVGAPLRSYAPAAMAAHPQL